MAAIDSILTRITNQANTLISMLEARATAEDAALAAVGLRTRRSIAKLDGGVLAGADPLFTIAGGPIWVTNIFGLVTTLLVGAANGTLQATTTVPAATVAMSTTVAIDDDAAGTSYTFLGPTGILTPTTAGLKLFDYGSTTLTPTQYFVPAGNINFLGSAARVGVIAWYMEYVPLSENSVVTVAA